MRSRYPLIFAVLLATAGVLSSAEGPAASLARQIRETGLDPDECYRVRELSLRRDEARLYLTDGYLIFSKPVAGRRISAVFTTDVEGGDAEVLLFPPSRGERLSLAAHTGAPNLNEHLRAAVLIFADATESELMTQIRASPANQKRPEMGLLLAQSWDSVARNLAASFQSRLVLDLLSGSGGSQGFFEAALGGKNLGNFDLVYDPRSSEQIIVGQTTSRENRSYFDVWTSFQARSFRNRAPGAYPREAELPEYRINATLEPGLRLRVETRVTVKALVTTPVLAFEISPQMKISAALVDGQPAEVFQPESLRSNLIRNTRNDVFLVIPAQPLQAGRDYIFELHHDGAVVSDAGNRVYFVGARGNWYPGRGIQFSRYDITFRYPQGLDLVSTGELVEDKTEGEWNITRRKTDTPVRLAGFNLGVYERARVSRAGYMVEVCANRELERALQPRMREPIVVSPSVGWPRQRRAEILTLPPEPAPPPAPNPLAHLQELATEIASALEFMAARFGPPPLRTLVVSPIPGTFGQGFPGLIYLSTLAYLGSHNKPIASLTERQQTFFSDILHAHETAHQWWGNLVMSAGYHDDWLMEALANYSALLVLEKRRGTRALETTLDAYRNDLTAKGENGKSLESAGPIVLGLRLEASQTPQAWRTITYEKGSWVLHMLRRRMGDEKFAAMLGELRRRYQDKPLSTEQFRMHASEFLPPKGPDAKAENFFEHWIYGTGIPSLKLKYSVKGKAPALKLTGTITQSDVNEDFSAEAPIEIQFGRGKSITHWVRTSSEPVAFTIPLRQAPTKVQVDTSGILAIRN